MTRRRARRNGKPVLYGPSGSPIAYTEFYEAGRYQNRYGDLNPWMLDDGARDTHKVLSRGSWLELMKAARFLFANAPILRGALLEQATYSFPLTPQYVGPDKDWGAKAEEWLYNWKHTQNLRGPAYTCEITSRIRLVGRKVDGDIGTLLTFDEDTEYPRIQLIRAHRIGSRQADGPIETGPYRGKKITNGVISNKYGTPIAYNVMGDTEEEDVIVPASNLFLTHRPLLGDEFRGLSELVASVLSFHDIKRLREYEMRAQQAQASNAITERNEEGEPPPGADFHEGPATTTDASGTASGLNYKTFEGGLYTYFMSNSGGGLEFHRPNRPGADCQAFESSIIRAALYGIEWDPDFALALKEPGGAWARTVLQKVNSALDNNRSVEVLTQQREDSYGLSLAMKLGLLPKPKSGDWYSWNYTGPARLTADSGNEETAKREAFKLGTETLQNLAAEKGKWWEEIRNQREVETRDLLRRSYGLKQAFPELTLQECINLLEQRTPNLPVETKVDQQKAEAPPQQNV